ncbi:MAG: hypothetical protein K0S25_1671 [Bacillus sp. (in: firmicutes)]|nr:hypothetical protein [Bacillus sp. (in: firmicutes)]
MKYDRLIVAGRWKDHDCLGETRGSFFLWSYFGVTHEIQST